MKRNTALSAISSLAVLSGLLWSRNAAADTTLFKPEGGDGWEFYSNGRINAFFEYTRGTAEPTPKPNGHSIQGGGLAATTEQGPTDAQGKIDKMRIASGFIGNVLGFGVKRMLGETTVRSYISIWFHVESEDFRKYQPSTPDAREGYIKLEGPWGSVIAGRALTLFSRGATEIDFLYGHGYGLGYPADIVHNGPAAGHIGFGVLANGFAAGVAYATPPLAGLQLTAGLYDPAKLTGSAWERTGFLRPEAELTYDLNFGTTGKLHLFVNGEYQKLYKVGQSDSPSETSKGFGAGGRVELGPLHLGVATHYGHALGVYYALEASSAVYDDFSALRDQGGYYAQAQLALGTFDINAGAGVTRVYSLDSDLVIDPVTNDVHSSVIKTQTGFSGAVVYHPANWLHFDADYFRSQFRWTQGEKQDANTFSVGTTITW